MLFIEQGVDAAVFLVEGDEEGVRVAGVVGDGLKLLNELCCLVGGW